MLASALPRRESNCQHSNIQAYLAGGHRQKFQSVVPKDTSLVDCVHRKPCSSVRKDVTFTEGIHRGIIRAWEVRQKHNTIRSVTPFFADCSRHQPTEHDQD